MARLVVGRPLVAAELRPSPCFYRTRRRRTVGDELRELQKIAREIPELSPYGRMLAVEIARKRAALKPVSLREAFEDLEYAALELWRSIVRAVRA
jgi:hypothetical protein